MTSGPTVNCIVGPLPVIENRAQARALAPRRKRGHLNRSGQANQVQRQCEPLVALFVLVVTRLLLLSSSSSYTLSCLCVCVCVSLDCHTASGEGALIAGGDLSPHRHTFRRLLGGLRGRATHLYLPHYNSWVCVCVSLACLAFFYVCTPVPSGKQGDK